MKSYVLEIFTVLVGLIAVGLTGWNTYLMYHRYTVEIYNRDRTKSRRLRKGDSVWLRGPIGGMTDTSGNVRKIECRIHDVQSNGTVYVYVPTKEPRSPHLVAKIYLDIDPTVLSSEPVEMES